MATAAGVFLIALADRLRLPSIALLLLGGIALGPQALGLIDPFTLGRGLETVVTLAVAIVLFEGGLTLDIAGFRREPQVIIRMLTIGVLVTWAGTAAAVLLVYDTSLELAIITGSLVIVTGPTVVSPLLRRIGLQPRLHHILYWEGVLVDAVGVFVAVLCFEWIAARSDQTLLTPLGRFASRFAIGAGIGLAVGFVLGAMLRRRWIPPQHTNIVVLGSALLALGAANTILAESGILAVIVAGLVVSLHRAPQLKALKRFKLELTEVGIGLLFVLLAARLDLHLFVADGGRLLLVVAVILLLLRPLDVLLSTWGQRFTWRERAFLSWLAPRGIVAASMASLFSLRLARLGYPNAQLLETLTYAVIGITVLVQGLSAPRVARLLGLQRRSRATWLLIGDPTLTVALHRQLRQTGARSLVLTSEADRRAGPVDSAVAEIVCDPLMPASINDPRIADVETVLALCPDPALNDKLCEAWSEVVGRAACFRWDGDRAEHEISHGVPLWHAAPGPAPVRAGLEEGRLAIEALEVGPAEDLERFGESLRPLLSVDGGRISVVEGEVSPDARAVVALRRRTPGLYGLVRDALVVDQQHTTFEQVITALLQRAAQFNPDLPIAEHVAEILDREQTMPTTIGTGVAIPHVYDDRCDRSTCYVASIANGLEMLGPDHLPVRLIFLLVSPTGKASEHLRSLGALAHLVSDGGLIEVLSRQRTRGRLLTLLRERE